MTGLRKELEKFETKWTNEQKASYRDGNTGKAIKAVMLAFLCALMFLREALDFFKPSGRRCVLSLQSGDSLISC